MMKFKKHIAVLFDENSELDFMVRRFWERTLSDIFTADQHAEVRVTIKGQLMFLQITDME